MKRTDFTFRKAWMDIHSIFSSTLYPHLKCTANIQTGQPGTKKRKAICRTETDRKDGRQEYPFCL